MSVRSLFAPETAQVGWIPERCVHHRFALATCGACVDHCPRDAWLMDEDGLSLDTERCDGCGLCVPACPEQALSPPEPYTPASNGDERVALFACEESGVQPGLGVLPCIHALGANDLLKLYRRRIRELKVAVGDCNRCARRPTQELADVVAKLNMALSHDGLSAITLTPVHRYLWRRQRRDFTPGMQEGLDRRAFFRRALQGTLDQLPSAAPPSHGPQASPPAAIARLLSDLGATYYRPQLPEIQALACDLCLDCVRACPHGVLTLKPRQANGEKCVDLSIDPTDCSGCGICVDLCRPAAITIHHWRPQTQNEVAMRQSHLCPQCGIPIFSAAPTLSPSDPCTICRVSQRRADRISY